MFVKMVGLYGLEDSAWYRKQGIYCFDFVYDKKYASQLTKGECEKIMNHAEWYCKQYGATRITIEEGG